MVDVYIQSQVGVEFSGALINSNNPYNVKPEDLTGYDRVYVRFFRPDGTSFSKDGSPRDTSKLTDTDILYTVSSDEILDMKGDWSYTVGVQYTDGTTLESHNRELFWVI